MPSPPVPPDDEGQSAPPLRVTLWRRHVGSAARHLQAKPFDAAVLTSEEAAGCARYLRSEDAELCRESRFLLRCALGAHLGRPPAAVVFRKSPMGKPELDCRPGEPPLRFNLSHADGMAVVAVVEDPSVEVGVDIERLDRPVDHLLFEAALAPAEREALARLANAERPAAFLRLWTMKEAALKAAGVGLGVEPSALVCLIEPPALLTLPPGVGDAADYTLLPLNVGVAHAGALAVRGAPRRTPIPVWQSPL